MRVAAKEKFGDGRAPQSTPASTHSCHTDRVQGSGTLCTPWWVDPARRPCSQSLDAEGAVLAPRRLALRSDAAHEDYHLACFYRAREVPRNIEQRRSVLGWRVLNRFVCLVCMFAV